MGIQRPRNRVIVVLATALGLASAATAPAQAQTLGDILDRLPAANEIARNLDRQNRIQRYWHGPYPWWHDRYDRDRRYHRHRGETEYERQSRGLYRPGYDIDRVLRNHYNGNRQ